MTASCGQKNQTIGRQLQSYIQSPPASLNKSAYVSLKAGEQKLKSELQAIGLQLPPKIYYCNTERPAITGSINLGYQNEILEALECLNVLIPQRQPLMLDRFTKDFSLRYESRKIPLMEALDPDAGVGYGHFAEAIDSRPLLQDLRLSTDNEQAGLMAWTTAHQVLFKKWNERGNTKAPILLRAEDIAGLKADEHSQSPPTIAVMFRIVGDRLFLESAGNASSTALLGRFTLFSPEIHQIGKQLAEIESAKNPDVIFAEIGQLSDSRTDNINRRAYIYSYEIPINNVSLLPPANQVPPSDLLVYIEDKKIILESAKLKKRIIPRLSSAFNPGHNHLALFRVLYDLQYQGLRTDLNLSLEYLFPGLDYYPRVSYKNVILAPAKWHLSKEQLHAVRQKDQLQSLQALRLLIETLDLPERIALIRADQQLVFNLYDRTEAAHFLACLGDADKVSIQEYFLPDEKNKVVTTHDNRPLVNQFLAFLFHEEMIFKGTVALPDIPSQNARQEFIIGSQWLYFKIYCTIPSANAILADQLFKITRALKKEHDFGWFFIRYHDPGHHIRFRVRVNDNNIGSVVRIFRHHFFNLVKHSLVREYQADTYRRELHRYGTDLIHPVEQFFQASSELVIRYLRNKTAGGIDYPEHQLAIAGFHTLLAVMLPEMHKQLSFLEKLNRAFFSEFKGDRSLTIELDKQYRQLKPEFKMIGNEQHLYQSLKLRSTQRNFEEKVAVLKKLSAKFTEARIFSLVGDLIHMHLNRLFPDQQRKQEMVLYHCFYKYKLSAAARNRNRS